MVVNKNALHDIVMNYIPTKKNINDAVAKKILPAPIFKGPVPTLGGSVIKIEKPQDNLVQPAGISQVIVSKESPKMINDSLLSNINIGQNIKNSRKKKHILPIEKSVVERLIEHKVKSDFAHNIISKSAHTSYKKSPRSNLRTNSRKYKNYMKSDIISAKKFEVEQNIHKNSFRSVLVKLDGGKNKRSSNKRRSSKKSKKSKKNSIQIKHTAPSYLRNDLERLLNDNDNIAFQRIR
jgi:hypothetical protein